MKNSTPLTVLHIASGDLWAGAEVQLFALARKLAENPDISVRVILLNHGILEQELARAGIRVTVVDETGNSPLAILWKLVRAIRQSGADVVHTHRLKENILGSMAALLAGAVPSIRTVHGAPEHRPSPGQLRKYAIRMLDHLCARYLQKAVVAVSSDLASILSRDFPAGKLHTIENGIDVEEIRKLRATVTGSGGRTTPRIGIAGRLVPVKRVDLFIRCAHYMAENYPEYPASWHIYGDGPLRGELELLSRQLGLGDTVHFEGHSTRFINELAGLDVLMMTSDHEGTPMVLLEALALEIPVIAHSVGGIIEVLENGNCGILVEDHTPRGYAAALAGVLGGTTLPRDQLVRAIRRHLASRFSSTQCAAQYARLYAELA